MNELEATAAHDELKSMMEEGQRYKLLELAVKVLKTLAVLYFAIAFYSLFLGPASETTSRSLSEKIGPLASMIALVKDALVAFLIFVSGEMVRILLDIRRTVQRLVR